LKYLHGREPLVRVRSVLCGGRKMAGGIPYRPARAKGLRYQPDIYARYGGDDGDCEVYSRPWRGAAHPGPRSARPEYGLRAAPQNRDPLMPRARGGSRFCSASFRSAHAAPRPGHDSASRGADRARVVKSVRLSKTRAQGKPGAGCTRSLACESDKAHEHSHHRFTETSGLPCAIVLTAYFVLSPVTGLFCHRRSRIQPATLTPASGRQDHTTSPSASAPLVNGTSASTASRSQRS
jgi:hypothetical protein